MFFAQSIVIGGTGMLDPVFSCIIYLPQRESARPAVPSPAPDASWTGRVASSGVVWLSRHDPELRIAPAAVLTHPGCVNRLRLAGSGWNLPREGGGRLKGATDDYQKIVDPETAYTANAGRRRRAHDLLRPVSEITWCPR